MSLPNEGTGGNAGIQTPKMDILTGEMNLSADFFDDGTEGQPEESTPEPSTTQAPPEQGQGVDGAQTPPSKGQDDAGQQEADAWNKHFESPEAMYAELQKTKNSYKSLLPEFTKKAQELSQLKKGIEPKTPEENKQNNEINPQQYAQQQQQYTPQQQQQVQALDMYINRRINSALEQSNKPLAEELQQMKDQMQEQYFTNELTRIHAKDPEFFEQVYPSMKEVVDANPNIMNLPNSVQLVYNLAKVQYLETHADEISNQRQAQATQQVLAKQGVPGAGQEVRRSEGKSYEESLADEIVGAAHKYNGSVFGG